MDVRSAHDGDSLMVRSDKLSYSLWLASGGGGDGGDDGGGGGGVSFFPQVCLPTRL